MDSPIETLLDGASFAARVLTDGIPVFAAAVGACVTLLALLVMQLVRAARNPVRRRVLELPEGEGRQRGRADRVDRALAPIRPLIVPRHGRELAAIRKRLVHAGYRGEKTITLYFAARLALPLVLAAAAGAFTLALPGSTGAAVAGTMAVAGLLGMLLPSYYLDRAIKARRIEIVNGFPDVLDLIVACTEAGLGLNDAIHRVSRETTSMFPALSTELALVNSQIRAGVERVEALHGLAERTGLEEINSFVSMVSQSIRFGTSIADTLRIFAEEFRDNRMQRAEEQAAKVGTKLIFPLILCIFPSFFVVTIGPAVISIVRVFDQLG